jgi:hypothetical protein
VLTDLILETINLKHSLIKGYHTYKIKPPICELPVDREYTNIHDTSACLVWVPPITDFAEHRQFEVTDNKRELTISDMAGLPMGHVPKGIAGAFRTIMDTGGHICAVTTGEGAWSQLTAVAPHEW